MARLSRANVELATEIIGRYPVPKSALIPLLHLAQEQDGWLTPDAMEHIAELIGITPAEALGTASFYEMFKREPVGTYVINVCTDIACTLVGGDELLDHASETLGIKPGNTTVDGTFSLNEVQCIAACTEAPCLQANYRYAHNVSHEDFDQLVDDLRNGRKDAEIPVHGILGRVRQQIPSDRKAGAVSPDGGSEPAWMGSSQ